MNNEFDTVAWIHGRLRPIQIAVIVQYDIDDDNRPDIWDIVEAVDPENSVRDILVENEEQIIYSKLEAEILGTMTDAAEMIFDIER